MIFLGPGIWEIVPDYIEKCNSLEEFKLKIKLWNPKNCPCSAGYEEGSYHKLVFYKVPFNFLCSIFYHI